MPSLIYRVAFFYFLNSAGYPTGSTSKPLINNCRKYRVDMKSFNEVILMCLILHLYPSLAIKRMKHTSIRVRGIRLVVVFNVQCVYVCVSVYLCVSSMVDPQIIRLYWCEKESKNKPIGLRRFKLSINPVSINPVSSKKIILHDIIKTK